MKCEFCGKDITINWGDGHVALCDKHSDKAHLFLDEKMASLNIQIEKHREQERQEYEEENSPEAIKGRIISGLVTLCLLGFSIFTGSFYLPGPNNERITEANDPIAFWVLIVFFTLAIFYAFITGYKTLKQRKRRASGDE